MIPDDIVEQVREHADIVAIVGETVKLKRSGSSYRGPCPFHQGKDPNFSVSPRFGYMCFVCHEKGDVFTFVQKRLGMDFVDAVKYVGAKSGIEVKEISRDRANATDPRERFWEMNAAAAEFFRRALWEGEDEAAAQARGYVTQRSISHETAERFGLGFAPREPKRLREHLGALGYDDAQQMEAGLLVVKNPGEEPRPRFRGRLMFPIYDAQGRVIAFGGRVLGQGEPKYLNSPESPTFQKGRTLYGLNWSKHAIRRDERAILVEGYFDCIRLMAAGVESVVAPLGTALTDAQAEMIRKYTTNVFLLYDSDNAGLKATFRAGDVLLRYGAKVSVITLPDGNDPDTFVSSHGPEGLQAQIGNAIDVFERKLQILQRADWFSDIRRKRIALDRLLPTIRATADPITFGIYVSRAAEVARISQEALQRELRVGRKKEGPQRDVTSETRPGESERSSRPKMYAVHERGWQSERELLRVILQRAPLIESVAERITRQHFRDARHRQIFTAVLEYSDSVTPEVLAQRLPEHTVAHMEELLGEKGGLDRAVEIRDHSIAHILELDVREQLDDLGDQLRLAAPEDKDGILKQITMLSGAIRGGRRWKSVMPTIRGETR